MDYKEFEKFRNDFRCDVSKVTRALSDFAAKWKHREPEINSLTPEQTHELEGITVKLDLALKELE